MTIEEGQTMLTIDKTGMYRGSPSVGQLGHTAMLRAIAVDFARSRVKGTTALVDNSGGTAVKLVLPGSLRDYAASGSNLATKADFEAGLTATLNALAEVVAAANGFATKLGLDPLTFTPGAATDGTIAAVPVTVAGATTGPAAAAVNAKITVVNNAFYNAAAAVKRVAAALDVKRTGLDITGTLVPSVGAISADTGSAGANGVLASAAAAVLAAYRGNVHVLAAILIAAAADKAPSVLATD